MNKDNGSGSMQGVVSVAEFYWANKMRMYSVMVERFVKDSRFSTKMTSIIWLSNVKLFGKLNDT